MQTGKIVPPSRSDNIQMEQVTAKRRYEVEIKTSCDNDNFYMCGIKLAIKTSGTSFCCE